MKQTVRIILHYWVGVLKVKMEHVTVNETNSLYSFYNNYNLVAYKKSRNVSAYTTFFL